MASDPWEERLARTDLAWRNRSSRLEQTAAAGERSRRQKAEGRFSISHFSFVILEFQTEDDHEERGITMKNDK